MQEIHITTREEYFYILSRKYEPLVEFDYKLGARFLIPNQLRQEIQNERFPNINKFYRFCYDRSNKICEETSFPLPHYSAVFVSHILTRGAHPAMAKDPRNINILRGDMHGLWETGGQEAREQMRIWIKNEALIESLKKEYYAEKRI